MTELTAYTSKDGSLWALPEGPNHAPVYVACTDADDITEPKGDVELIRCFGPDGKYQVVGDKTSPPDAVTSSLTSLTYRVRSALEKIRCEYGLVFLQRSGGRADAFCNWDRALILTHVRNTEKTYGGIVKREEDVESTRGFAISAYPPVIDVVTVEGNRKTVAETMDFSDVYMVKDDCATTPVVDGIAVALDSGMYAAGDVWVTDDGGLTWTVTTGTPLIHDLTACTIIDLCHGVQRYLVAGLAAAAVMGQVAYSDDGGVTWTVADVGFEDGVTHGGGLFAIDQYHIWLAGANGAIYFSSDGGENWTIQENGAITAGSYSQIEFLADGLHGYAVAAGGIVAKTVDGGLNWTACTVIPGTPILLSVCVREDDYVWVGDADGGLWWTEDAGVTWTQRTGWTGSGIASTEIHDIAFANDYVGFMIVDTAGPVGSVLRTIDGGYSWEALTIDANSGLLAMAVGDENYAVVVGHTDSGTGYIAVISE